VNALTLILIVAWVMLGMALLAVIAWLAYTSYLNRVERRLAGDAARHAIAAGLADPNYVVRAAAVDAASRLRLRDLGRTVIALLQGDPSPWVRERAALATGLLGVPGGEVALLTVCHGPQPLAVRAAAALAIGAFEQESIVARVVEMSDEAVVRQHLRRCLTDDPVYRLLGRKLSAARHFELRALGAGTRAAAETSLAEGLRSVLDAGERIRFVSGLRALQGEQSLGALLHAVRGDPSPDVRAAALTAVGGLLDADELLALARRALSDPSVLVRRAAVGLFARIAPERALPSLLETLRAGDDPAVLASVAALAEAAFPTFAALTLGMPLDGEQAERVAEVARYVHHPDLARLLSFMARGGSPDVRRAIAELWRHRPDAADADALEALALDPVVGVRKEAAAAAATARRWDLLGGMADDPDQDVRREVALALGNASRPDRAAHETLDRLADDREMAVRAAAYVGRLLQGRPVPFPPGLDQRAAAGVVVEAALLPALRQTAQTASVEERRLAAALALALVQDDVARQVARTDPVPAIRHRVSGALDLAVQAREDEWGTPSLTR
jgi:HEAT repeat protein